MDAKSRWRRLRSEDPKLDELYKKKSTKNKTQKSKSSTTNLEKPETKAKIEKEYKGVSWDVDLKRFVGTVAGKKVTDHENKSKCAELLRDHVQTLLSFNVPIDSDFGQEIIKKTSVKPST